MVLIKLCLAPSPCSSTFAYVHLLCINSSIIVKNVNVWSFTNQRPPLSSVLVQSSDPKLTSESSPAISDKQSIIAFLLGLVED